MLIFSLVIILFGIVIIISPEIIAYVIGTVMIFTGLIMCILWGKYRPKRPRTVNFGRYQVSFRDTFKDK